MTRRNPKLPLDNVRYRVAMAQGTNRLQTIPPAVSPERSGSPEKVSVMGDTGQRPVRQSHPDITIALATAVAGCWVGGRRSTGLRAMLRGCVEPQLTVQEWVNIMPRAP